MTKQSLLFTASVLVLLPLLVAGCTSPEQGGSDLVGQDEVTFLESNKNAVSNDTMQVEPITESQSTMKQLSDFAPIEAQSVTIVTNKGPIEIELFREQAPLTTLNFLTLAQEGFYNGIVFHRVIPDFMAQVGDPLTKEPNQEARWGSGGPGYTIADEFDPTLRHDKPGVVSMANAGPNTGGSQFFITHEATPWLNDKHAVFGQVTSGMDVVLSLTIGDTIEEVVLN